MIRLSSRSLLALIWILSIGALHAAQPRPTRGAGAGPPTRPATTISVTTAVDDFEINNTCSLREAVYAAVHDQATDACAAGTASDVIALPAATYVLTRTGLGEDGGLAGDLDITGTLHISGVTSATTIIDGNQTDRILEIFSGAVSLDNLTLRNGVGRFQGGAILLRNGNLAIDDSIFDHNASYPIENTDDYGGALYTNGTAIIRNSVFTDNVAEGAYFYVEGFGGVIYATSNAHTTLIDSTVKDTQIRYLNDAIYNYGYLSVSGSTFTRNTTPIFNRGTAVIKSSQFVENIAPTISNHGSIVIDDSEIAFTKEQQYSFYCTYGGGILNEGQALITNAFIHDNITDYGGGVVSMGKTHIRDSAIVRNTATNEWTREVCYGDGGGIYAEGGSLDVENTTIAGNRAEYSGGGIYSVSSATTITNTTVVSNYAYIYHPAGDPTPYPANAGGINARSPITITNTLIANNSSRLVPDGSDCNGTLVSANSLILVPLATCVITGTPAGTLVGVDPLLGALADHGGNTLTYDLLPGSPAIDAGALSGCPDHDQRGVFRPQDGDASGGARCDIGAYEDVNPETAVTATPTTIPSATTTPSNTATATATSTASATPLATATVSATATSTATTIPTATPSSTATAIATATSQPTATTSPAATATPPLTATATAGSTPTATSTAVATPAARLHTVYLPYVRR
jgi:CSLREA domain-containing protein